MSDPLTLIRARKQEIVAEITRLSAQLDALRAELPDLEAAERVLSRFSGGAGTPYSTTQQPAPTPEPEAGTSKPPNTPTISDMILEALRDAKSKGLAGLQPHGLTRYIAQKWWPNVPGVAISPIAWRMAKRGDLRRDGHLYMLPKNSEAADDPSRERLRPRISTALRPVEPAPGGGT